MSEGTGIDTTSGTDHIRWVEPKTFPGGIASLGNDKEEGAFDPKNHTDCSGQVFFWMDESKLDSR